MKKHHTHIHTRMTVGSVLGAAAISCATYNSNTSSETDSGISGPSLGGSSSTNTGFEHGCLIGGGHGQRIQFYRRSQWDDLLQRFQRHGLRRKPGRNVDRLVGVPGAKWHTEHFAPWRGHRERAVQVSSVHRGEPPSDGNLDRQL